MSYSSGCHNLVMKPVMISTIFIIFFISFFPRPSLSVGIFQEDNPLQELPSREELVQLAGYGEERLSTVLVSGTLLCQACLHAESQLRAWPISGALVAVKCRTGDHSSKTSSAQAVTDEYGDFLIDLPSHLHSIPNLERACAVKVLQMPRNAECRPANARKHKPLKLSSVGNGIRTYTAGDLKLLHLTSRPFRACTKREKSF